MDTTAPTNTAAVVSLVSGILAWIALPVLGTIVAIFTGHVALHQIRAAAGLERGEGLALAGLVLGWVQVGLLVLVLALVGWLLFALLAGIFGGLALIVLIGLGILLCAGLMAVLWTIFFGMS
ncbi:MAG: DUF4190 domain-containing protein [Wenzhouxiangellaceae bacterium]